MLLKLFSVRDGKGEIYGSPFVSKTIGEAERSFKMLVNDSKSMPYQFPEDFDLYEIGVFDDVAGKMDGLDTPRHVVKAVNVKDTVQ